MPKLPESSYSEKETARRRDEVIRRMANTPPRPNGHPKSRRLGKKKLTGKRGAAKKGRAPA